MNKNLLIAKSQGYLSYLFREPSIEQKVKRVYLFGSVARNDFGQESDIDLFIDVDKKDEKSVEKSTQRALKRFTGIEEEKWRFKGISQKFSLKVGSLNEWKIKSSLEKEGILLYSISPTGTLRKYLLYSFEPINAPKKRIKVLRTLFGRKEKVFQSKGLIEQSGGKVVNLRTFIIPSDNLNEISSLLSKEKVNFKFEEIWL